ncbi:unnamed protein product [Didymodactylos carnosus]|uniref:Uncharacterized protein n=1 Tax=Didymodactylos carnosus TaxID=1234261 RepID=A0A8S2EE46_9BILA|nr:unnamed protein product [Didymodactylos carnosus]CAF3969855.1 unnamed protein product [Didymodactylos carnosus]
MDHNLQDQRYSRIHRFPTVWEEQTQILTTLPHSASTIIQTYPTTTISTSQMPGPTSSSTSSRVPTPTTIPIDPNLSSKSRVYISMGEPYNRPILDHGMKANRRQGREDIQTTTGSFSPTDEDFNDFPRINEQQSRRTSGYVSVPSSTSTMHAQSSKSGILTHKEHSSTSLPYAQSLSHGKEIKDTTKTTTYHTSTMTSSSPTSRTKPADYFTHEVKNQYQHEEDHFSPQQQSLSVPNLTKSSSGGGITRRHSSRRENEKYDPVSLSTNSVNQRTSTMFIDEHTTRQNGEKHELKMLNNRFEDYLNKIKHLADINSNLRRQINEAYRRYMGRAIYDADFDEEREGEDNSYDIGQNDSKENRSRIYPLDQEKKGKKQKKYYHPRDQQLLSLRDEINDEVRQQTLTQIRLQRANYDTEFYRNEIKFLINYDSTQNDKLKQMKQQLEQNTYELDQLKTQYEKRENDLIRLKQLYDEYITKIVYFTNEYDTITFKRMESENQSYNLNEQIAFEQEYRTRRSQEYEYLEKFEYDFNQEFNKNELQNIIKQIRDDYKDYNKIRINELENIYKTKLNGIKDELQKRQKHDKEEQLKHHVVTGDLTTLTATKAKEFKNVLDVTKKEHQNLIEQNYVLKTKLEQLEQDLQDITEKNKRLHENSDLEHNKLQNELPELECIILRLRETTVSLWAEINTYRCLLIGLLSPTHPALTTGVQITEKQAQMPRELQHKPSVMTSSLSKIKREESSEKITAEKYRVPIATPPISNIKSVTTSSMTNKTKDQREQSRPIGRSDSIVINGETHSRTQRESDGTTTGKHPYYSSSSSSQSTRAQHTTTTNGDSPTVIEVPYSKAGEQKWSSQIDNQRYLMNQLDDNRKVLPSSEQYHDEVTGFTVHIEDGIVWVRI